MISQAKFDEICARGPAAGGGPSSPEPRIRHIGKLLALIPNNDVDYDAWIARAHQVKALALDETDGAEAFDAWSQKSGKYDAAETAQRWATVAPTRTAGLDLLRDAEAADAPGFAAVMQDEARPVFDDGVAGGGAAGGGGYLPSHANMRDAILRREKGWLGWLSNAPARWAAFNAALGRWSIGETDAAMRSAVRKEIAARLQLPVDAKVAREMSRAAWALAVHALLKHHAALEIPRGEFNADADMLGVPGGALRLSGMALQAEAGRPDHMLSKAVRFAPGGRGVGAVEWERFVLEFCSGDRGLVAWLQGFCGYCLTGHTTEHVMLFLYGPGGNGKSLFLDTIGAVMGDYHQRADHRLFMAKSGNFHLAPLAALEGARLVTCPDVPQNAVWDMGLVKLLTGGGSITANHMRENPFSFFPECKLILAGNDKPRLESVDEGVRRRLRLVPCLNIPATIDRGLPDKLLREGEGILRWMLDGWEMWSQFGLPPCAVIDTATDEYLLASDVFGRWLRDEITEVKGLKDKTRVNDLWKAWDAFRCREGAMRANPYNQETLTTRLRERGIGTWGRDKRGAYLMEITLKKTPEGVF
jgi:P4 family phage/plasmid primase-like protien